MQELAHRWGLNDLPDLSSLVPDEAFAVDEMSPSMPDSSHVVLDTPQNMLPLAPFVTNGFSDDPKEEDYEQADPPLFCHDGTERRIQRPKDAEEQKKHYSGKKKTHTVKNILLVNFELFIQFLGKTHPGTIHDKRAADETPYPLPQGSHLLQDLGFLVFKLKDVLIYMPIKKPKCAQLTDEQKATNRALAQRT